MQHKMHEDIAKVLISRESLRSKVKELGEQIAQDYQDKEVIAVAILKGSVVFFADLIRAIDMPVQLDFMSISLLWKFPLLFRRGADPQGPGHQHLGQACAHH